MAMFDRGSDVFALTGQASEAHHWEFFIYLQTFQKANRYLFGTLISQVF